MDTIDFIAIIAFTIVISLIIILYFFFQTKALKETYIQKIKSQNTKHAKRINELNQSIESLKQKEADAEQYSANLKHLNQSLTEKLKKKEFDVEQYSARLRQLDQSLTERESDLKSLIDTEVIRKLSSKSSLYPLLVKQYPIFYDFPRYDHHENPRLYSALSEPMHIHDPYISAKISGSSGELYTVTLSSCTCPDFQHRRIPCKHMYRLAVDLSLLLRFDDEHIRDELLSMNASRKHLQKEISSCKTKINSLNDKAKAIERVIKDSSIIHPWAAKQIADIQYALDMNLSRSLIFKRPPALKASEKVANIARELRTERRISKELQYQLETYKAAFPWLSDFDDISPSELISLASEPDEPEQDEYSTLKNWLSPLEYKQLSTSERYQLALDRWKHRKKSNWEAGRDFERYVGYQYEKNGYSVEYSGALLGKGDLGRDLVARKNAETIIIQCKRWNENRIIHEKHVFQLYGSVVSYVIEHPLENVCGLLATTCPLSELAMKFAEYLHIDIDTSYKSRDIFDYPMIKCNIGNTSERIYHLPFDQQYDRVVISPESGEFYASTVKQAEAAGFRRAYRWHSNKEAPHG